MQGLVSAAAAPLIPEDYFSDRSALYAAFRPAYPEPFFDYLASLPSRRDLALDCGTGNGQAAVGLANRFAHVVAIDGSSEQLQLRRQVWRGRLKPLAPTVILHR